MVTITPFIRSFFISFNPSTEVDVAGYLIHAVPEAQLINGTFTPSEANKINDGPETSFTYILPSGAPAGNWAVRICAYDTFGIDELNYSGVFAVQVPGTDPLDTTAPDMAGFGWATPGDTETGLEGVGVFQTAYINIAWTFVEPSDFSNYLVQWKVSTDTNWNTEVRTTAKKYKFSNLVAGLSYDFQVVAVDRWNNKGAWSATKSITSSKDTTAPGVPTLNTLVSAVRSLFISWVAVADSDVDVYVIDVAENSTFTTNLKTYTQTATSMTFSGVAGTTYYVRVKARDYSGNSSAYCATQSAAVGAVTSADINSFAVDASKVYSNVPVVKEVQSAVWTANTPAGGITWTAHTVIYQGKQFNVVAGNTTATYVYGNFSGAAGSLTYATSSNYPTLTAGMFVMAKNTSGKLEIVWNSEANVVIGYSYIMDAAIGNAKISDLSADKINVGTLSADRIGAGSIATDKLIVSPIPIFSDTYSYATVADVTASGKWASYSGAGELTLVASGGYTGGKYLSVGNNNLDDSQRFIWGTNILFDPTKLYKISAVLRRMQGAGLIYVGWAGIAADGTTLVNSNGANSPITQHYHGAWSADIGSSWTMLSGYTKGYGASIGTVGAGTLQAPGQMHPLVKYIRPFILVNFNSVGVAGITDISSVTGEICATEISGNQIATGTLSAATIINVGDNTLQLDGGNRRITVNDGVHDRVTLGKQATGTYGIRVNKPDGTNAIQIDEDATVLRNVTADNITVGGAGIICGTQGTSQFKVWDAGTNNVNMYVGDYNSGSGSSYLHWDGSKMKVKGDIEMSPTSTISWANFDATAKATTENPSYLTSTKITQTTIESPTVTAGTFASADGSVVLDAVTKYLSMTDASNNSVKLTPGELDFTRGGYLYKSVKRIDSGMATNGTFVSFNPPFLTVPTVTLSNRNIPTYVPAYAALTQRLNCSAINVSTTGFMVNVTLQSSGSGYRTTTSGANIGTTLAANVPYEYTADSSIDVVQLGVTFTGYGVASSTNESGQITTSYFSIAVTIEVYNGQTGGWSTFYSQASVYTSPTTVVSPALPQGYQHRIRVTMSDGEPTNRVWSILNYVNGSSIYAEGDVNWLAIEGGR